MKTKFIPFLAALILSALQPFSHSAFSQDPLPSWADGKTKSAIIDFVTRVTDKNSRDYIAPQARVTSFDNDGVLWPEKPVIEGIFALERMQKLLPSHPEWRQQQPFKALIENDKTYITRVTDKDIIKFFRATHSSITELEFDEAVDTFFYKGVHPFLNRPYTQLGYLPMRELLDYLKANGFRNFINTAGDIEFARAIATRMYGIPAENVIGTTLSYTLDEKDGKLRLVRGDKLDSINERENKAINFRLETGRHPVIAVGKIKTGNDISILRYSQSSPGPTLQILVQHNDPVREYEYGADDNESLEAAKKYGWLIVSIRADWSRIFDEK